MNEFEVISIMNEAMLNVLKNENANYEENLKIEELLKDEAIFFKISKSEVYEILRNVGVKQEKIDDVYKKLTSPNVYYDLLNKGKIAENDENIIIKYNAIKYDDLFKKKRK